MLLVAQVVQQCVEIAVLEHALMDVVELVEVIVAQVVQIVVWLALEWANKI